MSQTAEYELWIDGEMVAGVSGPKEQAWQEIMHYLSQYMEDGEAEIWEVKRERVVIR